MRISLLKVSEKKNKIFRGDMIKREFMEQFFNDCKEIKGIKSRKKRYSKSSFSLRIFLKKSEINSLKRNILLAYTRSFQAVIIEISIKMPIGSKLI